MFELKLLLELKEPIAIDGIAMTYFTSNEDVTDEAIEKMLAADPVYARFCKSFKVTAQHYRPSSPTLG